MNASAARAETVLRAIIHEVRTEKLTFLAGSIAYHAFISILPLLLLVLAVLERTPSGGLRDAVFRVTQAVLTDEAGDVILQGISQADTSVSILGGAFLVWGALRIFRGLDTAFSAIYETERQNTIVDQLGDGLVLLGTVALAIVGVGLLRAVVTVPGTGAVGLVLEGAATTVALVVVLLPMYYIFPDTDVSVAEVLPGTAFAAIGLTVAHALFTTFQFGGPGGNIVAGVLVLLTWLYVTGLTVLLGVAINAVLSNRSADIEIEPLIGGVERTVVRSDQTVEASVLLEELDRLAAALEETDGEVTVELDDQRVTVPGPGSATVDRSRRVFSRDDSVGLVLTWWPAGES